MIDKNKFQLTVITPTIGRQNLDELISTIEKQTVSDKIFHILMWDEYREDNTLVVPEEYNSDSRYSIVIPWGLGKNGQAPGSALRAVAMTAAFTPYVTFADDDVYWDENHAETMLNAIKGKNWASCYRKIYSYGECLGEDRFESVGDDSSRRVPYEMLDGNCMIFRREFGVVASQFYRETKERNDDRLLYSFLKEHAGERGKTGTATINQVCPDFLIDFFKENCTR